MIEQKNAIITDTSINIERDCLLIWLHLKYVASTQNFGGYVLFNKNIYDTNPSKLKHVGNYAGLFISRCMEIAGVIDWDDIILKIMLNK